MKVKISMTLDIETAYQIEQIKKEKGFKSYGDVIKYLLTKKEEVKNDITTKKEEDIIWE